MHTVPVSPGASAAPDAAKQAARTDDESFGFWDFLDIINPLQHIPIVNVLYREITGDEIGAAAKLVGGGLYGLGLLGGGWIGLASGAVDFAVEGATGSDIAGHAMDFLFGDDGEAVAGGDAGEAGGDPEAMAAALAAFPRPSAVVVRSESLTDAPRASLFGGGDAAGDDGEAQPEIGPDGLAAMTGQVLSPDMGQALLHAAQGAETRGARRMVAPGLMGFSLGDAEVQVETGVTRDRATGRLSVGAS